MKATDKRKKKQLYFPIGWKVSLAIIVLAVSVTYFVSSLGLKMYTVFEVIRKSSEMDALGTTVLIAIENDRTKTLFRNIKGIYDSIPEEEKSDPYNEEYLSHFADIEYNKSYQKLINLLYEIKQENELNEVYFLVYDSDKHRDIVVADAGVDENNYMAPGFWVESNIIEDAYESEQDDVELYEQEKNQEYDDIVSVFKANSESLLQSYAPYYVEGEDNPIGYIYITSRYADERQWATGFEKIFRIFMGVIMLGFWILAMIAVSRMISKPVRKLVNAANSWSYAEDKLSGKRHFSRLNIKGHDEIQVLYEAMSKMELKIIDSMQSLEVVTAEKQRIGTELGLAADIQKGMMPQNPAGDFADKPFDIFAFMKPAREVGGDFYDYFRIDEDRIGLVIADVSDKGVPAALFMVVSRTLLRSSVKDNPENLGEAITSANRQLCENNERMMFVTAFVGIYSVKTGEIRYVNAGHENPVIYRNKDNCYVQLQDEHDIMLGLLEDAEYTERTMHLEQKDRLFLYTDGIPEARNVKDNMLGMDGMMNILNNMTDFSGQKLLDNIIQEVQTFSVACPQSDDITMLLLELGS